MAGVGIVVATAGTGGDATLSSEEEYVGTHQVPTTHVRGFPLPFGLPLVVVVTVATVINL